MKKHTMKIATMLLVFLLAAVLLAACGGSGGGSASGATTVNITLTDFQITSSLTSFKVGVPYHFVVKNSAAVPHEIWIDPVDASLTPDTSKTQALAGLGPEVLTAGATQSFDYTFTKAYPAGAYEFACHLPGHYESGMHVGITVQ
jgi:uncharacterized cupredoxin-like copper-binding protein